MSFNFGNTSGFPASGTTAPSAFGLGSTPTANKTGFGTANFSFGATTGAPTAAPNFNLSGNTAVSSAGGFNFKNLVSSAPTTATTAVSSAGGFSFLNPPATATGFGGFGSTFGANAQTATTTTLTSGTSFGTGTGFSGFGSAPTTSTQSTGFGFGSTSTTPGSLFSGFGQTAAAPSTGFGGFGSSFGAKPAQTATTGGFGGFGAPLGGSTFGQGLTLQSQQQQQQQVPLNPNEALYNAIFHCNVYGDERDTTLARWNLLQALWGSGKAYYSQSAPPVEITQQNPFCRFKAVGYSRMPATENKEGLVAILFNKPETDIRTQQQQLVTSLTTVLGNKPNLSVSVDSVKPMSETKCQVLVYVQEKGVTGVRRIPGVELAAYLLQPMQKQQLTSMGVENVFAQVLPDKEMIKAYLEEPPAGIDPRLWKQAILDNPDDGKYVPVPMVGFGEVRWRMKCQEQETKLHQAFLDRVADDIAQLKNQQARTCAKAAEYKRKFVELEHRILKVLVQQEVCRKVGMALQPEEEVIRSQLETLEAQLNAPTQFKGRLNEMLSQMRMQRQESTHRDTERYSMEPAAQDDIKQFLSMEQNGMAHLVDTIQADMASLRIIKEGMNKLLQGQGR